MRIIPDDMQVDEIRENSTGEEYCEVDGIPIEVSDRELDEIGSLWIMSEDLYHQHLSIFFKKLIQLKQGVK
jgi:hypothetical protein